MGHNGVFERFTIKEMPPLDKGKRYYFADEEPDQEESNYSSWQDKLIKDLLS